METSQFEFKCGCCEEIHKGVPGFNTTAPIYYYSIPEKERELRTELTSDTCIIDNKDFFVKGCLELPVIEANEPFIFSSWISLSEKNFLKFINLFNEDNRENEEPMVGWYSSWLWEYKETEKLAARIHLRNGGLRPEIELEPKDHPLALAQSNGITKEVLIKIFEYYTFNK